MHALRRMLTLSNIARSCAIRRVIVTAWKGLRLGSRIAATQAP
jgi:hypothetical protein